MKSRCVVHFVLIVMLVFSGVTLGHAQTGDVAKDMVRVDVPFDFYVGNHKMPAGTYFVGLNPDTQRVDLSNADSEERVYLIGVAAGDEQQDQPPSLEFDHVANDYFLKGIRTPEASIGFQVDKSEEQITGTAAGTRVVTPLPR